MSISEFWSVHRGETCLIVGNGPSLRDIPLSFLEQYPTFGTNLIYKLIGFTPTYYTAVDHRVLVPLAKTLETRFPGVPKFVPDRYVDYQARPVYYFHHRPGDVWIGNSEGVDMLTDPGLAYVSISHVALQLAYYMGYTTMLMVGMDNTGDGMHFYGDGYPLPFPDAIDLSFGMLRKGFEAAKNPRRIINLSTATQVTTIERGDWRGYDKSSRPGGLLEA